MTLHTFSRSLVVVGLLALNACGAGALTSASSSSGSDQSLPFGSLGPNVEGNTPAAPERPMTDRSALDRAPASHKADLSVRCRGRC